MSEAIILKRHPDEHFFDTVKFQLSPSKTGRIETVERWKDSYLSGDEWRFSYHLVLLEHEREIARHAFGISPETAMRFAPLRILDTWPELNLTYGELVVIKYHTREQLIWQSTFASARRLFAALPSDAISVRENTDIDFVELDKQRKHFCSQPGCTNKPDVLYRIKKEYDRQGREEEPHPWSKPQHRQFCEKHSHRGDCALEDADNNYELVEKAAA